MTERQGYNNYLTRGYTGMPGCSFRIAVTYFFKQKTPGNVMPTNAEASFLRSPLTPGGLPDCVIQARELPGCGFKIAVIRPF